ncbi:MAG: hypothetical protein OXC01_02700 [Immundisolibacterales bacterium]|nr:hypothetical protein [Immundisolibacterales bacterium]
MTWSSIDLDHFARVLGAQARAGGAPGTAPGRGPSGAASRDDGAPAPDVADGAPGSS